MANPEHVKILKRGADVWNEWRLDHPHVRPNFSSANIQDVDLCNVSLIDAFLNGANLSGLDLSGANFSLADLSGANLSRANLSGAKLTGARLMGADLSEVNLSDANLLGTNLSLVELLGTTLTRAYMGYTILAGLDLRQVDGLETVLHLAPSELTISTFIRSQGKIPDLFLQGCGVPEEYIAYMKSLANIEPIQFYQCFISYSSKDEAFTTRLHNDLQAAGVRCWYARHDLQIGDPIWDTIDREIRVRDKLMVVLSENSIQSDWVRIEVNKAFEEEDRRGEEKVVLFPIRLDDTVIGMQEPWAHKVRQRHIGDFRDWKNHDSYQAAFDRLLRDLKAS